MIFHRRLFFLVCLLVLPSSALVRADEPLKVLFVGNSYTYVNDLPSLVVGLADAAGGRKIETGQHLVGGCSLKGHVKGKKAIEKIREKKWDVVVLQGYSLEAVLNRESMEKNARILDEEIKKQGAKTVLYLTWARQHIPQMQDGADPSTSPDYGKTMFKMSGAKNIDLEQWCSMHKAGLVGGIDGAYFDIAKELNAQVAPVGVAWKKALAADPKLVLHQPDKSHPSPKGSYLAACVFYATLLDKSPVGLPAELRKGTKVLVRVAPDEAKMLQEIAWQAVQEAKRRGNMHGRRSQIAVTGFILGADISWVQEQEDEGVRFTDRNKEQNILAILKNHGFNWIRLRIFHDPKAEKGYSKKGDCDLDHTLQMAKRIKTAGMGFLLDFHYSDTWADPGHQFKPAAWVDLHGTKLENAVHNYTRGVVAALKKQGTPPDMVQIGNEISNGFLWPDGNVWKSGKWDVFCGLIEAGIAGAKEADPSVKILLHLALGGQNAQSRTFLDKALAQGVEFDIIGQSYYSKWNGTLDDFQANLTDLAGRYKQDIIVVEYSVPNIRQINGIVHGLPGGKGLGTFIWEPTKWEGPALFDGLGNTKPEIEVYPELAKQYGKP